MKRPNCIRHWRDVEKEFIYVLEGNTDACINGYLSRLEPDDSVGLPAGTGVCHTFINNTDREDRWIDHPPQFFGSLDGEVGRK